MRGSHRHAAVLLLVVLLVAAGCTGGAGTNVGDSSEPVSAGGGSDLDYEGQRGDVGDRPAATGTPSGEGAGSVEEFDAQAYAERQLILTGHVAVEVGDFEAARANLTDLAERHGGFVSDTDQQVNRQGNESWTTGRLVLRVPRENFTAVYEAAKAEGDLLEANRQSQDVTDQLVDLEARLENLRAERDQLRRIYEDAETTEDVLRVQERLSEVQGEIERLEARQQSLQRRVALSTIEVRLVEPRPDPDRLAPDRWYDVPLLSAFLESVDGVVVTLRALSVALAYALPYLLVFGVPLAAIGYVARQRGGPGGRGGLAALRERLPRRGRGGDGGADDQADDAGDGSDDA